MVIGADGLIGVVIAHHEEDIERFLFMRGRTTKKFFGDDALVISMNKGSES